MKSSTAECEITTLGNEDTGIVACCTAHECSSRWSVYSRRDALEGFICDMGAPRAFIVQEGDSVDRSMLQDLTGLAATIRRHVNERLYSDTAAPLKVWEWTGGGAVSEVNVFCKTSERSDADDYRHDMWVAVDADGAEVVTVGVLVDCYA